jgi:hypothetical protein
MTLATPTTLRVTWDHAGQGPFTVWLVNTAEEVLDPAADRIRLVDVEQPGAGSAVHRVDAGTYSVEVERAGGPWQVSVAALP